VFLCVQGNVWALLNLVRWFVFQTRYWASAAEGTAAALAQASGALDSGDGDEMDAKSLMNPSSLSTVRAVSTRSGASPLTPSLSTQRESVLLSSSQPDGPSSLLSGSSLSSLSSTPPLNAANSGPRGSTILTRSNSLRTGKDGTGGFDTKSGAGSAAGSAAAGSTGPTGMVLSKTRTTGARFEPAEIGLSHHGIHWNTKGEEWCGCDCCRAWVCSFVHISNLLCLAMRTCRVRAVQVSRMTCRWSCLWSLS
jgi:hypothetical protein